MMVGRRPTTSVRIGDHEQVRHASFGNVMDAPGGGHFQQERFLRGPPDCSLLVSFVYHVALRLWEGELRIKSCSSLLYWS